MSSESPCQRTFPCMLRTANGGECSFTSKRAMSNSFPGLSGSRSRIWLKVKLPSVHRVVRWYPRFPFTTTARISWSVAARLRTMALSRRAPFSESSGAHGSVS